MRRVRERDSRLRIELDQVSGAARDDVQRFAVTARTLQPVGFLALLGTPIEIGACKKILNGGAPKGWPQF